MKKVNFNDLTDEQLDRLTNDLKTINNNIKMDAKDFLASRITISNEFGIESYFNEIAKAMEDYADGKINKQRIAHNKTLLMLGSAKQTIDLVKIMLIGIKNHDLRVYPNSDKTPHYFDMIAEKISEFDRITGA